MIVTVILLRICNSNFGNKNVESPNPDNPTEKAKETKQHNTIELLNPMSDYVQHTSQYSEYLSRE